MKTRKEKDAEPSTERESNRPVASFSKRGVSISVFENPVEGRDVPFYKAAIQRTFMKDGEFRHSNGFSTEDIPVLVSLLQDTYRRILELEDEKRKAARRERAEGFSDTEAGEERF